MSTSLNLSVEQTPRKINKKEVSEYVLNNVDYITIPHLPTNPLKVTSKSISKLSDRYGVDPSRVIPHIGARNLTSKAELTRQVKNFKDIGVQNLLLVGGHQNVPMGPFAQDDDLFRHVRRIHNFKIYCGIYPGEQTVSGVTLNKYSRYDGGFSQLCLSTRTLSKYKASTRIGVPSRADWDGLWKYMKICGVGPSLRYPIRNVGGILRFMTYNGFDTTRFVRALQPHTHFHVYDFGRLEETIEDLLDLDV